MLTLSAWPATFVRNWGPTLKAYIDGLNTGKQDAFGMAPPVGYSVAPSGLSATAAGATPVGTQWFEPVDVGAGGWNSDAAVVNVTTAGAGTNLLLYAGIYPTDPATGYPLTSPTPTFLANAYGSVAPTSTGIKAIPWQSTISLIPGRYWLSTLLLGTVTTQPQLTCISGMAASPQIPLPAATTPGTQGRGLSLTSQTALKSTATAPSAFGINAGALSPVAQLRRVA